jgi:hypothetical protein
MPLSGPFLSLLFRGLLAGLIAGLLAGAVAFSIGETNIDAAIAIEESHAKAEPADGHHDEELVSRTGQKAGLFLATGLAGLALGAIFASVLHYARRYTALSGTVLAIAAATGGWLAIEAVPFFKYPANPPAVGDPDTIDDRTLLWLAAVLVGIAAVGAAVFTWKLITISPTIKAAGALAAFLMVAGIGYMLLPGINEVPADFPATLLWRFRVSSLATQATLWITLGIAFAALTELASAQRKPSVLART